MAVATGSARDLADLARAVARSTCDLLKADGAVLRAWDERDNLFCEVPSNDQVTCTFAGALRPGEGIAGQAALRREVLAIEHYAAWEHALPIAIERGVRSAVAAPLMVGDRVIGVLTALFHSPSQFDNQQTDVLKLLVAQVAPAVAAAQLSALRTSLYERERLLRDMSRSLACDVDRTHVLGLAARSVAELVGAPFARIWLVQPDGSLRCAAAEGYDTSELGLTLPIETLPGGVLVREGAIVIDDISQRRGWRACGFFGHTNLLAYLAVPIRRAGAWIGVAVAMREGGTPFGDDDQQLLASLADAIATGVANTRSLDRLADSERRLRAIYEAIACGVLVQDAEGVILHANSTAEEIFGFTLEEMRGRTSTGLWRVLEENGAERPPSGRNAVVAARSGVTHKFTTCVLRPDGGRRWLQGKAVPIRGTDGAVQVVTSFIDITERKRVEEVNAHQARHDALTGLPNRWLLGERLRRAIAESETTIAPFGLLIIDLDHFKEVNDTLGHHAGDTLLQQMANRLRDVVRESDTVARLGGDEFAILVADAGAAELCVVADKVQNAVRQPLELEGQAVQVSASVGVVVYPSDGLDETTLLRRADAAMYVAKRSRAGSVLYAAAEDHHAADLPAALPVANAH